MSQQVPPYRPDHPPWAGKHDPSSQETRRDAAAALAARAELGPEYEEHVAAGLADRVEQLVALRTAELRYADQHRSASDAADQSGQRRRFVLGIVSLGAGIPITAISGEQTGLAGMLVSWAGIVGVNLAASLGQRRR